MKAELLPYVGNRLMTLFFTIFIAATLIWLIPRFSPVDPAEQALSTLAAAGGAVADSEALLEQLRAQYGLDQPWYVQYFLYLKSLFTFDFGFSTATAFKPVSEIVATALPWTIGLMTLVLIITFVLGNLLGALMAWERTPGIWKVAIMAAMVLTAIPPMVSALLLQSWFAFGLEAFPKEGGGYDGNITPGWSFEFMSSVLYYGFLPALAIIVVTFGFWSLGMRGLMVSVQGEDYTKLAEAKGLRPRYILYKYMIRNAILPQITAFALKIGLLVAGQVLVERIFAYPGMGRELYSAILANDYPVIQGICFVIILMTAISVFIVDLIYPLFDPRIKLGGN